MVVAGGSLGLETCSLTFGNLPAVDLEARASTPACCSSSLGKWTMAATSMRRESAWCRSLRMQPLVPVHGLKRSSYFSPAQQKRRHVPVSPQAFLRPPSAPEDEQDNGGPSLSFPSFSPVFFVPVLLPFLAPLVGLVTSIISVSLFAPIAIGCFAMGVAFFIVFKVTLVIVAITSLLLVPAVAAMSFFGFLNTVLPLLLSLVDKGLALMLLLQFVGSSVTSFMAGRRMAAAGLDGDLDELERRLLAGGGATAALGVPIVLPLWKTLPFINPAGWLHLFLLRPRDRVPPGTRKAPRRPLRYIANLVIYIIPTALFLLRLSPPDGIAVWLAAGLGFVHLEMERTVLRSERMLALLPPGSKGTPWDNLAAPGIGAAATEQVRGSGSASGKRAQAAVVSPEEDQEPQRWAEDLATFDEMLEARWWIGRGSPRAWSVNEVGEWLKKEGFDAHVDAFRQNDVNGNVLLELSDADLADHLGVQSFGIRRSMMLKIASVKANKK